MPTNESLASVLDKAAETLPLKELVLKSPAVFAGLTDQKADLLKQAIGVSTIADLANNKFVLWAQALNTLAQAEKLK